MKTYLIKNSVEVYKVNYKEGEGDYVDFWSHSAQVCAETPMTAIEQFFKKELGLSFDEKLAHVDDLNGANVLLYSHCVDEENEEIDSASQAFVDFKAGKRDLYSANSQVEAFELVPIGLPNLNN